MGLLNFFIILFIIVILHELGHLIVAKINKVHVKTFSIGFGWRIFGIKFWKGSLGTIYYACKFFNFKPFGNFKNMWNWKDRTEYRIAPIFLGGFCAMEGETQSTGKTTDLVAKTYLQKLCIVLAGVGINFITGFLAIYTVIASKVGISKAFVLTLKYLNLVVKHLVIGIIQLIQGEASIVTASEMSNMMVNLNFETYLVMFGALSITLGFFNLLPIPALDGGFPWLWIFEKLHKNGELIVHRLIQIFFILLMILQFIILFYWLR